MNRRMVGTYFDGRRRVYWGQQGGFYPPFSLSAAPQRPPARPGGPLPGDRSYSPGGRRRISGPIANPAAALLIIPGIIFIWQVMKRIK